jgi:hypothetical protein
MYTILFWFDLHYVTQFLLIRALGSRYCLTMYADVTNKPDAKEAATKTFARFGRLDYAAYEFQ